MAVFKYFKRPVILVVAYVEEGLTLPKGLVSKMNVDYARKSKNRARTPVLYVVTNDMKAAISTIGKAELIKDTRGKAREISNGIKDGTIKVTSGDAAADEKADSKETDDSKEAALLLAPSQKWTNAKGKVITAAVVKINGDKVVFRMPGGKDLSYPIAQLSKVSQEKIRGLEKD